MSKFIHIWQRDYSFLNILSPQNILPLTKNICTCLPIFLLIKKPNKNVNRRLVLVASLWLFVSVFCLYPLGCCALRAAEWQLVLLVYMGAVFPKRLFWVLLGVEPRALCVLSKHSTTGLCPQLFPLIFACTYKLWCILQTEFPPGTI